ncbi:hypothetical protein EVA_14586 [gut metagenome]|uniref:Uncharacterized protein n=1 Tax=gut metagenome TaxID=749906 RepID=J9FS34_9ZZZZ
MSKNFFFIQCRSLHGFSVIVICLKSPSGTSPRIDSSRVSKSVSLVIS